MASASPRLAFDAAALARWAPDPVDAYTEIVFYLSHSPTAAGWKTALDRNLCIQPPGRRVMLVVHFARLAIRDIMAETTVFASDGTARVCDRLRLHLDASRLQMLLRHMQLDQTGWDFVGTVLFLTLATSSNPRPHAGPGPRTAILATATACVSICILDPLIRIDDDNAVDTRVMALTWSRMVTLSQAWLQTGKVCGVPFALVTQDSNQTLAQFLSVAATCDAEGHWNEAIVDATRRVERAMLQEAHCAQNELTRPSCPLGTDAIGLIAQFLAPPGTSQNALQAQRLAYAASVETAKLQVAVARVRQGARKLAQACIDKDSDERAKRQRV